MNRLIIAASVVVVLIVSAISLVVVNANDPATALQTEITEPETEVPLPETMEEHLQDLVGRGLITQEQLDDMADRFRGRGPWNGELPEGFNPEHFMERGPWNGELPEGFNPEHFMERGPWNGELPEDFDPEQFENHGLAPHGFRFFGGDEDLTDLLGVTPEELMDALADGTPLTDIIDDPEALVDSMVGCMEEGLRQAVASGHLTQAEADELIAEARSHAEALISGEAFDGEGFMGRRGPGGFHDFRQFGPHHRDGAETATAGYSL